MSNIWTRLFELDDSDRSMCKITAIRGFGSYVVEDDLGRSFIVTGSTGFKVSQQVTVMRQEIVSDGLQLNQIRVISV